MPASRSMTRWGVGPNFAVPSLAIFILLSIANSFIPALLLPFNLYRFLISVVLIACGVAMCISAASQVHRAFNQGKLVTSGLYAYIRNPVYAAWILLIAPGVIVASGLLLLTIMPFAMYAMVRVLIVNEDRYLEQKFGQEYLEYKKNVNSIIPKLRHSKLNLEAPA